MTSYETIFTRFLRKIDDVELARQIELYSDLAEEDMIGWLHSAVARIGCIEHESITLNDEDKCVEEDLSEIELEFYSLGMKVEWLTPIVESRVNLAQMFGGKEEKLGVTAPVRCIRKRCSVFLRICWDTLKLNHHNATMKYA